MIIDRLTAAQSNAVLAETGLSVPPAMPEQAEESIAWMGRANWFSEK